MYKMNTFCDVIGCIVQKGNLIGNGAKLNTIKTGPNSHVFQGVYVDKLGRVQKTAKFVK